MQTKLPIITQEECREYFYGTLPEHQICTFDRSNRRSACSGDEGGPLVYNNRLLGILLFTGWRPWTHPDIFFHFNDPRIHRLISSHMNEL